MAKKRKLTKEEIKTPDSFITTTDKAVAWMDKHKKIILTVAAIAVLAGLAKVGSDNYLTEKMNDAEAELYISKKTLQDKLQKLDESAAKALQDLRAKDKDAKAPETKTTEYFEANFKTESDAYATHIKSNSEEPSLAHALFLADLYGEYKQNDAAIELLQNKLDNVNSNSLLKGLAQTRLGALLADKGSYESAISIFNKLLANKDNHLLFPDTLLKKAFCHEKLGQKEEAIKAYQAIRDDHTESSEAKTAATYLRLLDLKAQKPNSEG